MYKLLEAETVVRRINPNGTHTSFLVDSPSLELDRYQEWIDAGNTPDPEFTPAELKAKTAADKEAAARAAFETRDREERWLASPEKAALK